MLSDQAMITDPAAPFLKFESCSSVLGLWFVIASICHISWVAAHAETWKDILYRLPCQGRKIIEAIEDCLDDWCNSRCVDSTFTVCPKRCERARMCARRAERRRQKDAAKHGNQEEEDYPCPLQMCAMNAMNFYRLHLPAPLPFVKRCKKQAKKTEHQSSTIDEQTSSTGSQERERSAPREASSTLASSFDSSSLASKNDSHSKEPNPRAMDRSSLINLARMQQWKTILEHQDQLLTRRQAKYRDEDGLYPLHWAVSGGPPVSVVQAMLDCYPSAARKHDKEGSLPLHFATHYGASVSVVEALLSVYPEAAIAQDKYGRTPLYSAVDKTSGMDVLQMLVRVDPTMIITPCLPVNIRRMLPEDHQQGLHVPRSVGLRTPLFLAWADVLSDPRSREKLEGKKLEKASFLLRTALEHVSKQEPEFPTRFQFLTASIVLDRFLPESLMPLIIRKLKDQVRLPDPKDGRLPLQIAAATHHYSSERCRQILELLLESYPAAAAIRDSNGQSALSAAVQSGKSWVHDGLERLFKAAPEAVRWNDTRTSLTPTLLAASRQHMAATYQARVAVVDSESSSSDVSVESSTRTVDELLESVDPYHILTRKHSEELKRRRQKSKRQLSDSDSEGEQLDEDLLQLDTIFALLHAEPFQIAV